MIIIPLIDKRNHNIEIERRHRLTPSTNQRNHRRGDHRHRTAVTIINDLRSSEIAIRILSHQSLASPSFIIAVAFHVYKRLFIFVLSIDLGNHVHHTPSAFNNRISRKPFALRTFEPKSPSVGRQRMLSIFVPLFTTLDAHNGRHSLILDIPHHQTK